MTLLELLQAGRVDEFNQRRTSRAALDFYAVDLSGRNLRGVDLTGANLEKADLSGCDLSDAILIRANLSGADLTGAILDRVHGAKARMREAYLGEARVLEGDLADADLTEADLTGFVGDRTRFVGTRFKGAVMSGAHLRAADLSDARLPDADLRHADLEGAVLRGAEMHRADLVGARMDGVDLTAGRLAQARLKGASLRGAVLVEADLTQADLTQADLTDADLSRADLTETRADEAVLAAARPPEPPPTQEDPDVELHFDDPVLATVPGLTAVLWDNPDVEEKLVVRVMVCPDGETAQGASRALAVDADQVLERALLPAGDAFLAVFLIERGRGAEVVTIPVGRDGVPGKPRAAALGYEAAVKPVFVADRTGVTVYGLARKGGVFAHHVDGANITERLRAPAGSWRGFCGRLDPVLLGKGGVVAGVRPERVGALHSAPQGYPGRLLAAAWDPATEVVTLAWSGRDEEGLRVATLGRESARLDANADVGSLDLVVRDGRALVAWTREGEPAEAFAAWWPGGRSFRLPPARFPGLEEVRAVAGGANPRLALTGIDDELFVVEVRGEAAEVVAHFVGGR